MDHPDDESNDELGLQRPIREHHGRGLFCAVCTCREGTPREFKDHESLRKHWNRKHW